MSTPAVRFELESTIPAHTTRTPPVLEYRSATFRDLARARLYTSTTLAVPTGVVSTDVFASFDPHARGMPILDAQADFRRARRAHAAARIVRWLTRPRRRSRPLTLTDAEALAGGVTRLKVVPIGSIVGMVEATAQFDASLQPAPETLRWRWERVALAHRKGLALPPIVVRERREGYYVLDGRHRVSLASAVGHPAIDARLTGRR